MAQVILVYTTLSCNLSCLVFLSTFTLTVNCKDRISATFLYNNCFLELFEDQLMNTNLDFLPTHYCRYVCDIFVYFIV